MKFSIRQSYSHVSIWHKCIQAYIFHRPNLNISSSLLTCMPTVKSTARDIFLQKICLFYPEYDTDTCLKAVFPSFGQARDTFKLLKDLPINLGVMETRKLWSVKIIPLKCRFFVSRIEYL